ncbi:hypothetical protein AAXB25_34015 [Paenibacillus lautus]
MDTWLLQTTTNRQHPYAYEDDESVHTGHTREAQRRGVQNGFEGN